MAPARRGSQASSARRPSNVAADLLTHTLQPPASSLLVTHTVAAYQPALALPVAGFFNKSDLKAKYTVATEQLGSGNFAVVKKATKTAKNTNAAVPQEVT